MSRPARFGIVAILLAILAVHAQVVLNPFTWDDGYLVLDNPEIRDLSGIPGMFVTTWGSGTGDEAARDMNRSYYRPVALVSVALQFAAQGADAAGFHAVNVAIHALAALALLAWLRRMLARATPGDAGPGQAPTRWAEWAALVLALLWAVHPIHSESISVVAYRSNTLGGLFTFATLALLAPPVDRARPAGTGDPATPWGTAIAAAACAALALWSKETSVVLPAMIVVQDLLARRTGFRRVLAAWVPAGLLACAYLWMRHQTTAASDLRFFDGVQPLQALALVPRVFHFYLRLCLAPWPLNAFYDWSIVGPPDLSPDASLVVGSLLLAGLVAGIPLLRRRRPVAALGLAVFVLGLLPASHLVPFVVGVADRFLYVPLAGLLLAAGDAFLAVSGSRAVRRVLAATGLLLLLAFSGLSAVRDRDWTSDEAILQAAIRDWPGSVNGHLGLARYYLANGRAPEAVLPLREVVRLSPGLAVGHGLLAAALGRTGDYPEGRKILRQAPLPQPGLPSAVEIARGELARSGDLEAIRRLGL